MRDVISGSKESSLAQRFCDFPKTQLSASKSFSISIFVSTSYFVSSTAHCSWKKFHQIILITRYCPFWVMRPDVMTVNMFSISKLFLFSFCYLRYFPLLTLHSHSSLNNNKLMWNHSSKLMYQPRSFRLTFKLDGMDQLRTNKDTNNHLMHSHLDTTSSTLTSHACLWH